MVAVVNLRFGICMVNKENRKFSGQLILATNYVQNLLTCVCRLWISTLCHVYLFKGPNKIILPNTCIPNA